MVCVGVGNSDMARRYLSRGFASVSVTRSRFHAEKTGTSQNLE